MAGDGCSDCVPEEGWACTPGCNAICGDGLHVLTEACDDGNSESGDGCDECMIEDGWVCIDNVCNVDCGDGIVMGDEECDHG